MKHEVNVKGQMNYKNRVYVLKQNEKRKQCDVGR